MMLLNSFIDTWSISLVFWGIHIFLFGYLAFKSDYIPKIWGTLLIIAFAGYVITSLANLLLLDYDNYKMIVELIIIILMLSEVALGLWLLIREGILPQKN